ncbi:25S rRNA (uracil2843-N3)-methyltransferase [Aspergillus thermomutatus]|uniref:25S rRNA (Uridine(2843)-N(3))-methyltransferase n=1 Tax=Aspergillus thermomutatus TaxID=41047 RepID=A0A397HCA4_ASPTH|nr:uncharacterized protein CDV56_108685 [Aspergillus thermomutatus]RHZ59608.1 hypothetical protein CDV56_108685 [Aspergillus thermomutatus]
MGPPRSGASKKSTSKSHPGRDSRKEKKRPQQASSRHDQAGQDGNQIDLSATIPLTLQQLLLNVFKTALLPGDGPHDRGHQDKHTAQTPRAETESESEAQTTAPAGKEELDIKSLVQTIKSHLYNRDFDSAFTDADGDLLRAYALRWSASRALGYAGIFKSVLRTLLCGSDGDGDGAQAQTQAQAQAQANETSHIVCIGGGAGAEIMALAAAWRDLMDETVLSDGVGTVLLEDESGGQEQDTAPAATSSPRLAVTAVDIADWSSVVDRLARTIRSPAVTCTKAHPAPLQSQGAHGFVVRFERSDVLSLAEEGLRKILHLDSAAAPARTVLVTLMFTLNELFSTSMAKTTAFLLRATDLLNPGTLFLVVDSPGSYSTLKLGKSAQKDAEADGASAAPQERRYPMKFLLDHTLLSVAAGKWEKIYEQDSRWWRRDAARLRYYVGEGAGLEDMRFQIHVYRRLAD